MCLCRRRLWSPDGLLLTLPAMSACVATHAFPSLVGLESQLLDEDSEATMLFTSILRYERDTMEFADALYRAGVSTVEEYVALRKFDASDFRPHS